MLRPSHPSDGRVVLPQQTARLVIELRPDMAPRLCENFTLLCTGSRGFGYRGSQVFRCLPGWWLQGGDFQSNDGEGGRAALGDEELISAETTGEAHLFLHQNTRPATLPHPPYTHLSASPRFPSTSPHMFPCACNAPVPRRPGAAAWGGRDAVYVHERAGATHGGISVLHSRQEVQLHSRLRLCHRRPRPR